MDAVQHYFSFQYVPEPSTMTRKVRKLSPGHYFTKCAGQEMTVRMLLESKVQSCSSRRISID